MNPSSSSETTNRETPTEETPTEETPTEETHRALRCSQCSKGREPHVHFQLQPERLVASSEQSWLQRVASPVIVAKFYAQARSEVADRATVSFTVESGGTEKTTNKSPEGSSVGGVPAITGQDLWKARQ